MRNESTKKKISPFSFAELNRCHVNFHMVFLDTFQGKILFPRPQTMENLNHFKQIISFSWIFSAPKKRHIPCFSSIEFNLDSL